jgi:hypothetical protein
MELYTSWTGAKGVSAAPAAVLVARRSSLLDLSDSDGSTSPAGEQEEGSVGVGVSGGSISRTLAVPSLEAAAAAARGLPVPISGAASSGALMRVAEALRASEARERHLYEAVALFEEMNQTLEEYRSQVTWGPG